MTKLKKIIISSLFFLSIPLLTLAVASPLNQGGTGWNTSNQGELLVGTSSPLQYTRLATGTVGSVLSIVNNTPTWVATSTLGFSSGGTSYWQTTTNGIFNGPGTAGYLVGINSTSPNSNLVVQGSSTAPTLPILTVASSSGSSYLTVLANGNVGIATRTPQTQLDLTGEFIARPITSYKTITGKAFFARYDTVGGQDYGIIGAYDWDAAAYKDLILNGSGKIGIGTTTPQHIVDIQGNAGVNPFRVSSSTGATLLTVLANGNVGIGSSSPNGLLSVQGTAWTTGQTILADGFRFYTGGSDGSTAYGDFRTNPATGNTIISAKMASLFFNYDHGSSGTFWSNGSSLSYAYMSQTGQLTLNNNAVLGAITIPSVRNTLDAGGGVVIGASYANVNTAPTNGLLIQGNVGINTTTPAAQLVVAGSSSVPTILSLASSTGTQILRVEADGDVIVNDTRYGDYKLKPMTPSIYIASTTLDAFGKQLSTATTTWIRRYPFPVTLKEIGGETIAAGTANCRVGDGTNFTSSLAISTTYATTTPTGSNTWVADEKIQFEIGSAASTPQGASCNFTFIPTP